MKTLAAEIIASTIDMIVCILYYNLLLGNKKKEISYPLWLFCFILMEAALYLNVFAGRFISGFALTFFSTLVSIFSMYMLSLMYNSNKKHRIFTVITFQIIAIIAEVLSFTVLVSLYTAIAGHKPGDEQFSFLMSKFLMLFSVFIVGLIYKRKQDNIPVYLTFRLLINPALSLVIIFCIWYSKEENLKTDLGSNIPNMLVALVLAFINFTSYFFLMDNIETQKLVEKEMSMETSLTLQEEKFKQMSENYKEVRSIVHDSLKHDRYILSCANPIDVASIKEYLVKDISKYTNDLEIVNSQNLAIDVLVNTYIKICRDSNIQFIQTVSLGQKKIDISDYDMNIILGNILENAVNAVSVIPSAFKRIIELSISVENNSLIIFEKNPCEQSENHVLYPDEFYKKAGSGLHGYGINNIYKICKKLNGTSSFETAENSFIVRIIIPL